MKQKFKIRNVKWEDRHFCKLHDIRMSVFVKEQKVPLQEEFDNFDPVSYHALAETQSGKPAGTGRLFRDPEDAELGHIGRMATLPEFRGTGCGSAIMHHLIKEARLMGFKRLILSSQEHACDFYARFGFRKRGEVYMDAGIRHIDMVREI